MKKQIIAGIATIACVALCAAAWTRSAKDGDLPAEPIKTAVSAKIEARSEEMPHIFISADTPALEVEAVAESEPQKIEITTEKKQKHHCRQPRHLMLHQNPHQHLANQNRVTEPYLTASLMSGFQASGG